MSYLMLISLMLCVEQLTAAFVSILEVDTTTGIAHQDFLQFRRCHHATGILNQSQKGKEER